ncbi:MAG: molybdenum cofactor cytidylyltransferase [Deltaproteobacteria bacterium]|nr:molybdenum cofactor cytidylyltransferase [Deltaproteobacteria bacterium]MBW2085739.1 molybdenum cofactor cytidylyltransferase [Deltaproteobacteria bacterium]
MIHKDHMISGVILAAGRSTRMGQVKQLLHFRGQTILGRIVENAFKSSLQEIIVVLGHAAQQIQQTVDLHRVKVVVNEHYDLGQSTSIKAGLAEVSDQSAGVMFILGDQPLIEVKVIDALIEGYRQDRAWLVIPTWRGRRGNPVLIARSLFPRLNTLIGDPGARVLFEEYAKQIKEIEVENDSIHFDLDTWHDYTELKKREGATPPNRCG